MTFINGKDIGYRENPRWWFEPGPDQFRIAKLDEDYPAEYFPLAEPPKEAVRNIVDSVISFYHRLTRKNLVDVVEFGCGGGWTLKEFSERLIIISGFEGSVAGCEACIRNGLEEWVNRVDIRREIKEPMYGKSDIAIFTECAEHIEIPFHGTLVANLCRFSSLIWFSSESPEVDNKPHLHHPGEMPLQYWINLFEFYNYGCLMLPDAVFKATEGRGRCIFYDKRLYTFSTSLSL